MPERKEDEIMAEYLLKGGKMLEKTCRTCGCPLFEYKKKTFCVVCPEHEAKDITDAGKKAGGRFHVRPRQETPAAVVAASSEIASELSATILSLCRRISCENDPDRCLVLMNAVKTGAEALRMLRQE